MKQVLVQGGGVQVVEVPAPQCDSKNILVKVEYSCISAGTEMAGVKMSGLPLYRRALKQPQHVKRVLEMAADQGLARTYKRISGMLAAGLPTGYSAAGKVIAVGDLVDGFRVGQSVACAGAGIASHAEIINVPVNLAVVVPLPLDTRQASTVTLGAIALQGVRRTNPALGEIVAVIGLGILGQLTVQMLKVNGCRVIGIDPVQKRIDQAMAKGMKWGINPADEDPVEAVTRYSGGWGADAVIITAASTGNELISQAMRSCRKKGRVVLVGDVGIQINREDMYKKELDFFIATSYGPGRYDEIYEKEGQDYPYPYVRWTENRNMQEYLALLAEGKVSLDALIEAEYPVDAAQAAFRALSEGAEKPLITILEYPDRLEVAERKIIIGALSGKTGNIRVAIVGAGGFATGMHLPNLVKLRSNYSVYAIMSRSGASARAAAVQFEAHYATTDYDEILADSNVDLVLICTRHHIHASMTLQALKAGKHVLVEKPLALNQEELDEIREFYASGAPAPLLMTGFNRRFAPAIGYIRDILKERTAPVIVNYKMNAGFIPRDHWVHGPEGGGRNIGEACHIYDLFNALTGAAVKDMHAVSIAPSGQYGRGDNFVATVRYDDGSLCTLTYTALGSKAYPKERMEIFTDGRVLSMDDYRSVSGYGTSRKGYKSVTQDKGHLEELKALHAALGGAAPWPISLEEQLQAMETAFAVEKALVL